MSGSNLHSDHHAPANVASGRRLRSGTAGSVEEPRTSPPNLNVSIKRPSHLRSRSYMSSLSPIDPKPRNAATMPIEASPPMHNHGTANNNAPSLRQRDSETYLNPRVPKLHLHGHKSRLSQDLAQPGKDGVSTHQRSHLHMLSRANSHRHTKSDVPARWNNLDISDRNRSQPQLVPADATLLHPAVAAAKSGGMLTRISTNLSGKSVGSTHHKPRHQYSASDFSKGRNATAVSSLAGPGSRPDLRRRATSDTRAPLQHAMRDQMAARYGVAGYIDGMVPVQQQERKKPLSQVELLLIRADKMRKEEQANITEADVQKLGTQLAESRVDLQEQLASNTKVASSLMRRLDDAHDMLFSTASSMIDTISSFQNLCQQNEALIGNFEHRAAELDNDTRKALERHRKALFEQRGAKIAALEGRSRRANEKGEEMSRRLENCRKIITNFTEREQTKKRAWRGVMLGTLSGVCVIILGFLLGFGLWWHKSYGGVIVRYDIHEVIASGLDQQGVGRAHGHMHEVVKERLRDQTKEEEEKKMKVLDKVPDEVKSVLADIAHRHNTTHSTASGAQDTSRTGQYIPPTSTEDIDDVKKLKKLFDKLEL